MFCLIPSPTFLLSPVWIHKYISYITYITTHHIWILSLTCAREGYSSGSFSEYYPSEIISLSYLYFSSLVYIKSWFSNIPSHSTKLLYFPLVICSMEKRIFIGILHSKIWCSLSNRRYLINSWQMTRMKNFGQPLYDWWIVMAWSWWFRAAFICIIELSLVVCKKLKSVDMAGRLLWKWWAVGSAVQKRKAKGW